MLNLTTAIDQPAVILSSEDSFENPEEKTVNVTKVWDIEYEAQVIPVDMTAMILSSKSSFDDDSHVHIIELSDQDCKEVESQGLK